MNGETAKPIATECLDIDAPVRELGAMHERARIVAWLRAKQNEWRQHHPLATFEFAANAIECGDHLQEPKP